MDLTSLFKIAGPFGYLAVFFAAPALLFSLVSVVVAIAGQLTGARLLVIGALLAGLATTACGLVGRQLTLVAVDRAMPNVPEDQKEPLRLKGMEEARAPVVIAVPLSGVSLLLCLAAVGLIVTKQRREGKASGLTTLAIGLALVAFALTGLSGALLL